jgi:hypothetical protein
MKTILIIVITLMITACAATKYPKICDAYGSIETSKDMAKK